MAHIIIFKDESVFTVDDFTERAVRRFLEHATNRGETHWDGCEWHHHACALAKLALAQDEIARLQGLFLQCETITPNGELGVSSGNQLLDALCKSIDEHGYDETLHIIQQIDDKIARREEMHDI